MCGIRVTFPADKTEKAKANPSVHTSTDRLYADRFSPPTSREVDGRHTVIEARVSRGPTAFRQVDAGEPVLAKVEVAVLAQHVGGVERLSPGSSLATATFIIATLLSR